MERTELSPEVWAFEKWLVDNHYDLAVEVCPRNDGEFFGAVCALEVLDDYLAEIELEDQVIIDALMDYAAAIGEVSRFEWDCDQDHDAEVERQIDEVNDF